MKKTLTLTKLTPFLVCAIALFSYHISKAQSFGWASQLGGTSTINSNTIKLDASGNVYTVGTFLETVDFDPNPATTYNLTSLGLRDIFLSKLDASGNFVWVKRIGAANDQYGIALQLDASGNIYLAGYFSGTADFDPGVGATTLSSVGQSDIYVCKIDNNGDFVWARQMGGTNNEYAYSMTVDGSGNSYISGSFNGTADFDPGAGVSNLSSAGNGDIFICKLDVLGAFVWAKKIGGAGNDAARNMAIDAANNLYLVGGFANTVDFDPDGGGVNLTSVGNTDFFIVKLSSSGTLTWAKTIGSTILDNANDVAVDGLGNVYVTGVFQLTADFDPGASNFDLTSFGSQDIFLLKLDALGDFVWAKQFGGTSTDIGSCLAINAANDVIMGGSFQQTSDFDPSAGVYNLVSEGSFDCFIAKIDASGNFVWAVRMGANYDDRVADLSVDAADNMYSTGGFQTTVDFDPSPTGVYNLTYLGVFPVFVHKLSPLPVVLPIELVAWKASCKNENTQFSWTTVSERNNAYFTIERSKDGTLFNSIGRVEGTGESNQAQHYTFTDTQPLNEITYYRLKQTDLDAKFEYSNVLVLRCETTKNEEIAIFPNPTTGKCTVQGLSPNAIFQIMSSLGTAVLEKKASAHSTEIDLSELPRGIYFLQTNIFNNTNSEIKKIVLR